MGEKFIKNWYVHVFIILFLVATSIPAITPYFHEGYFPTHDGEWAMVRLGDMFRELRDYQFPARFSGNLNFGYGYPLFNFAYPFPYYLGTVIYFFTHSFVESIKFLFAISVPLSAIGMYFASRSLWNNTLAGIISSICYIYFPYRFVDLYVRGSLGESLAFVLFPVLFFFVIKINQTGRTVWIVFGAITYASLILTHNIMAVLFSLFLLLFFLGSFLIKQLQHIFFIGVTFLLGLGLATFFWLPALIEKQYILLSKIPIADRDLYFVSISQFILPQWGYGVPTDAGGFSYQLGVAQLLIMLFVSLLLVFIWKKKQGIVKEKQIKIGFVIVCIFFFFTFLMFKESKVLWNLPLLSEINYPWTLLALLGFMVSLLAGFLTLYSKYTKYMAIVLTFLAFVLCLPYTKPEYYVNRGDAFYLTNDATTTSSKELMPLWVKQMPLQRSDKKVEIVKGKGEISDITFNSTRIMFTSILEEESVIRINTIYYPGWTVIGESNLRYDNPKGVMEIQQKKGVHTTVLRFQETPLRIVSNSMSILTFLAVLFLGIITLPFFQEFKKRIYIYFINNNLSK